MPREHGVLYPSRKLNHVCVRCPRPQHAHPQVLSKLIRGYNYKFQPRSHAVDLIETLHIVLCMLDRLTAVGTRRR